MKNFKSIAHTMGRGFVRSLWCTLVNASIGLAVYGYTAIPSEGGYVAVAYFILATMFLFIALFCMYIMGGTCTKGAKK